MRASIEDTPIDFEYTDEQGRRFTRQLVTWGEQEASFVKIDEGCDLYPPFTAPVRAKYVGHEEVCTAGDMFYLPPYHMPVFEEDTVLVEFSPKADQQELVALLAARENV